MNYTKGEIAGGWVYVHNGEKPIALVHPKYVDKFIAAPDMYEALKAIIDVRMANHETEAAYIPPEIELAYKALAKVEGKK